MVASLRRRLVCVCIFVFQVVRVGAKVIGAAVLPHGDFAFDPSLLTDPQARSSSQVLHNGSVAAGSFLSGTNPDVVVFTTPHGLQSSWNVGIYANSLLQGEALVGRDVEESYGKLGRTYTVSLNLSTDTTLADRIHTGLQARDV